MNRYQIKALTLSLALGVSASLPLLVQATGASGAHGTHGHGAQGHDHSRPASAQAGAPDSMASGEVRRIDSSAGRLTLRHGDIPNLDMPPMTMVFEVADRAFLAGLKPGDKVRFRAEKSSTGFVVTVIEQAP